MSDFDSLTWALEDWLGMPDIPDALRQRAEQESSLFLHTPSNQG